MHISEVNKATFPIINSFHHKLSHDDILWMEAISFEADECQEFQTVNSIEPRPKNLFAAAGFLKDDIIKSILVLSSSASPCVHVRKAKTLAPCQQKRKIFRSSIISFLTPEAENTLF